MPVPNTLTAEALPFKIAPPSLFWATLWMNTSLSTLRYPFMYVTRAPPPKAKLIPRPGPEKLLRAVWAAALARQTLLRKEEPEIVVAKPLGAPSMVPTTLVVAIAP